MRQKDDVVFAEMLNRLRVRPQNEPLDKDDELSKLIQEEMAELEAWTKRVKTIRKNAALNYYKNHASNYYTRKHTEQA